MRRTPWPPNQQQQAAAAWRTNHSPQECRRRSLVRRQQRGARLACLCAAPVAHVQVVFARAARLAVSFLVVRCGVRQRRIRGRAPRVSGRRSLQAVRMGQRATPHTAATAKRQTHKQQANRQAAAAAAARAIMVKCPWFVIVARACVCVCVLLRCMRATWRVIAWSRLVRVIVRGCARCAVRACWMRLRRARRRRRPPSHLRTADGARPRRSPRNTRSAESDKELCNSTSDTHAHTTGATHAEHSAPAPFRSLAVALSCSGLRSPCSACAICCWSRVDTASPPTNSSAHSLRSDTHEHTRNTLRTRSRGCARTSLSASCVVCGALLCLAVLCCAVACSWCAAFSATSPRTASTSTGPNKR